MKKLILTLALALSASIVAQAQPVYSNAVGMIKLTLPKGQLSLVHNPFDTEDAVTVADLFGDTLPNGTKVYFWSADQKYIIESYSRGAWGPGTTEINRVKSMFVSIPDNAPEDSYELVVSGNVPDGVEALQTIVSLTPGLTLTAFPYPTEIALADANLPAQNGDKIYFWDGDKWIIEGYSRGSWLPGTSSFKPGVGFYYLSKDLSDKDWTSDKPYTLD